MGGGGAKGSSQPQPIYRPAWTSQIENALTGMALGNAVKQNPNLTSILNLQPGQNMTQNPGPQRFPIPGQGASNPWSLSPPGQFVNGGMARKGQMF